MQQILSYGMSEEEEDQCKQKRQRNEFENLIIEEKKVN
jgi:hypothetical protein